MTLGLYLPKYLSEESQRKIFDELENFPSNINKRFYTTKYKNDLIQGDGLDGIVVPDYEGGNFRTAKGLLISNSCDVSKENKRLYPPYLSFAPIIDLNKWEKALLVSECGKASVLGHIKAIKEQKITPFFSYLKQVRC